MSFFEPRWEWVVAVRIVILETVDEMARAAADESIRAIGLEVRTEPVDTRDAELFGTRNTVIGLATGGTPLGLYRYWIERYRAGSISFAEVTTFNLDEYAGMSSEDPRSYHAYMREHLFSHIDLDPKNSHLPKGDAEDLVASADEYEWAIERAGGIDYQILGIGADGHIGFNEIGSSLASRTRVKTLTHRTRTDNARYFESVDEVPRMAITMGIGTIMSARSILLLATGQGKAHAIRDAIEGPVTAMVPASVLQMHPDVTVMLDTEASQLLAHRNYYMESERNRASIVASERPAT